MEFTKLDEFLFQSLDLCSIDSFSITISGIENVIGENDVIDFSKNFQDEVIEEIYKNLSTIQPGTVQLYFNLLFKKIEDYKTNKDWKYYTHFKGDLEHLEWQFQELLNQYSENEELLQIAHNKGGFKKYIINENNSKRLLIVERLKSEIEEIQFKYFGNKEKKEPINETLQSNFNLSLKVTDFTVLNKFSGYVIQLFRNENNYENKTKVEITASIYEHFKNLELNVNSLFKFSRALQEERINFALSIPGNEQREYFLNFYNGIINQRVKDIEEHIWEIIEFILGQKNQDANVTRESLEKECEWANFLLSAFSKDYSTKENIEPDKEPLPEYEYKSIAQKVVWLHELGILQTVLNECKVGQSYNWTRAANIIHSFTDINTDTIRQSLTAIFNESERNKKNNPLNNPDNNLFVSEMRKKFKLDKEKESTN